MNIKKNPTHNKTREDLVDWSHLAKGLPSETCYRKKDGWKDRNGGNARWKT